jgi:hypothetical protein
MTQTERFRDGLDAAFALTTGRQRVTSGPFVLEVATDDEARAIDFPSASPRLDLPQDADLQVAIVAGPSNLAEYFPPVDGEATLIVEDGVYCLWLAAPESVLFVYDMAARRGLMWLPTGAATHWVRSRPLAAIIHAHAAGTDWCPLHAAAVGRNGRFLVLAGEGGAGKTTAALHCLNAGWDYAGDDYILVNPKTGGVGALYASARLRKLGSEPLAALAATATFAESVENNDPRYELRVGGTATAGQPANGWAAALILPQRRGGTPFAFRPARAVEVMSATLRVTSILAPGLQESLVPKLMGVARMAPAFVTDTGTDPTAIPAAFERFLEQLP